MPRGSRHSFQAMYWFIRCLFGINNESFIPVRTFFKFINWHHNRRIKLLERIEATANLVIGKDMILYGRKRGSASGESAASVPVAAQTAAAAEA